MTPRPLTEVDGSWQRREGALAPAAVIGVGAVAERLAAAAGERVAAGVALRVVADAEYLLVLGAEHDLPWADGARYLGWDGGALTLATHRVVPGAGEWRAAALAAGGRAAETEAEAEALVVVLPEQIVVAPVAVELPAQRVDPTGLVAAPACG